MIEETMISPQEPSRGGMSNEEYARVMTGEKYWREQIAKEIEPRLYAALGMASMCWSEIPIGVFNSERAQEIGNELLELIARGKK